MTAAIDQPFPALGARDVHVWYIALQDVSDLVADRLRILSPDERQRANRLIFPAHRRRFAAARAALRRLLGRYMTVPPADLRFLYGPAGKPELAAVPLHFNVSHSGDGALIAIARGGPVGVDLEIIRPLDHLSVARGVLDAADCAALSQASAADRPGLFFRLWVRHEAQVKALGDALGARVAVQVYDLDVGSGCHAALATRIPDPHIILFSGRLPLAAPHIPPSPT